MKGLMGRTGSGVCRSTVSANCSNVITPGAKQPGRGLSRFSFDENGTVPFRCPRDRGGATLSPGSRPGLVSRRRRTSAAARQVGASQRAAPGRFSASSARYRPSRRSVFPLCGGPAMTVKRADTTVE